MPARLGVWPRLAPAPHPLRALSCQGTERGLPGPPSGVRSLGSHWLITRCPSLLRSLSLSLSLSFSHDHVYLFRSLPLALFLSVALSLYLYLYLHYVYIYTYTDIDI